MVYRALSRTTWPHRNDKSAFTWLQCLSRMWAASCNTYSLLPVQFPMRNPVIISYLTPAETNPTLVLLLPSTWLSRLHIYIDSVCKSALGIVSSVVGILYGAVSVRFPLWRETWSLYGRSFHLRLYQTNPWYPRLLIFGATTLTFGAGIKSYVPYTCEKVYKKIHTTDICREVEDTG